MDWSRRLRQRAGEFQAQQIVALPGRGTQSLSTQGACGSRHQGGNRGTRDLKFQFAAGGQQASNGKEHPPGADVQGSREFQEFLPFLVLTTDENRDRQRQTSPLTPLGLGDSPFHSDISVFACTGF